MSITRQLPRRVCEVVEGYLGPVTMVRSHRGRGSDFAATLRTASGSVFVKAAKLDGARRELPRIEVKVQPYLPECAPRLHWSFEQGPWLVMCFEHVAGDHADLSPGSRHLDRLAAALEKLSGAIVAELPVLPVERRFGPFGTALDALRGSTLVHTDLGPGNVIVGDRVWIVDWAWPTVGAPWLDAAFLIPRLIQSGHSPADAEAWARRVPAWTAADDEGVSAFIEMRMTFAEQRGMPALHDSLAAWRTYRQRRGGVSDAQAAESVEPVDDDRVDLGRGL